MEQYQLDRRFLLLATIAGISVNASLAGFFIDNITFSFFPLIASALSLFVFYQQNKIKALNKAVIMILTACFFIGVFAYSAFIKMQLPDLGSNFFSILVTMALSIWVFSKVGLPKKVIAAA